MKLKIICDNRIFNKGNEELKASWGLSIYIKNTLNILFDTGDDGAILINNLKKLFVAIKEIDLLVISHEDYDHIGGLAAVLSEKPDLKLLLPRRFPDELKSRLSNYASGFIEVDEFEEIAPDLFTTGSLGSDILEQALVLQTEKGLVVVTGCAHPGIVNILKQVKENLSGDIFLVIGGFHLMDESHRSMKNVISDFKKLGVEKVAPAHCTGHNAIKLFKKEYKNDFIKTGVGKEIEV